jgi:predicted site-specific integrase-resolvase
MKVEKAMCKKQIAAMLGISVPTLCRWMIKQSELQAMVKKKGSGTYLYTESEINKIEQNYKNSGN